VITVDGFSSSACARLPIGKVDKACLKTVFRMRVVTTRSGQSVIVTGTSGSRFNPGVRGRASILSARIHASRILRAVSDLSDKTLSALAQTT
jgi:hypothetical protein